MTVNLQLEPHLQATDNACADMPPLQDKPIAPVIQETAFINQNLAELNNLQIHFNPLTAALLNICVIADIPIHLNAYLLAQEFR